MSQHDHSYTKCSYDCYVFGDRICNSSRTLVHWVADEIDENSESEAWSIDERLLKTLNYFIT